MNGVKTTGVDTVSLADEIIVNRGGATSRQSVSDLANQLAALSPISQIVDSIATVGQGILADDRFEQIKALNISNQVSNATTILDENGYAVGFTIAAFQTGISANILAYPLSNPEEIAALAGKTIQLVGVYDATPNFLTYKPLSTSYVDIGRNEGNLGGTLVSDVQTGSTLIRTVQYTVQGDEHYIGLIAQVELNATAASVPMSLELRSIAYRVITTSTASAQTDTIALQIRNIAGSRGGASLIKERYESAGSVSAGVSFIRDPDTNYVIGWSIPPSTLGGLTYLSWVWFPQDDDAALIQGATVRVTIVLDVSSGYSRVISPTVYGLQRPTGGGALTRHNVLSQARSSTRRVYVIEGIFADAVDQVVVGLQNGLQIDGVAVGDITTSTTDTVQIADVQIEIIAPAKTGLTGAMATARLRSNIAARLAARRYLLRATERGVTKTIAATGGDFSNVTDAIAGSPAGTKFEVDGRFVASGASYPFFYPTIDDVEFAGTGLGRPLFAFAQADDTAPAAISNNSAVDAHHSLTIRNMDFTAENCRYVVHSDSANTYFRPIQVFEDCHFEHKGNESARAYQVAHGGSSGDVWSNCSAIGAGVSDGGSLEINRCTALGYDFNAITSHNWANAKAPMSIKINNSVLDPQAQDPTGTKASFYFANIGSMQNDVIEMVGNRLAGPVVVGSWPWQPTDPAKIPANKMLMSFFGHGNSPASYLHDDDGSRALRITSATTGASSSVAVSGTGATALFGGSVSLTGATGLAGQTYGWLDVGDHAVGPNADQNVTQMGKRLGDCSTVNKTLTILIDGVTTKTVTFNLDYRSVSNSTILAAINTALVASATADLFNVNELYRPTMTDEETRVYNSSSTTIKRKTAVAYATAGAPQGRAMTATDPSRIFAGIAYEDIKPGSWGRIKSAGQVRVSQDLLRSDSATFADGDWFGVGATDGQWTKSPAIPLLRAVNAADVRFMKWSHGDENAALEDSAWTTFTPSVTAQSGTLTTVSATGRYKKIGKLVYFQCSVTITTNGTGSGSIIVNGLPVNSAASFTFIGRESAATGAALLGFMNPSTGYFQITKTDNTYPGANGRTFDFSGVYEAA